MGRKRGQTISGTSPLLADALVADVLIQLHPAPTEPGPASLVDLFGQRYLMVGNPFDGPELRGGGEWTGAEFYRTGPPRDSDGPAIYPRQPRVLIAQAGTIYRLKPKKPVGTAEDLAWVRYEHGSSPLVQVPKIRVIQGEVEEPVLHLPDIVHPVTAPPRPSWGIPWVEQLVPIAMAKDPPMADGWAGGGFVVHSEGRNWVLRHEGTRRALAKDLPSREWAQYLASKLHDQVPGLGLCRTDTHLANLPQSVKSTIWILTMTVRERAKG